MPVMPSRSAKVSASCGFITALAIGRYFQQRGNTLTLLLCGGDKGSQDKDILAAKRLAAEWSASP